MYDYYFRNTAIFQFNTSATRWQLTQVSRGVPAGIGR
jgi:hypothetical protein